jgi:tRNA nucleotidyltransferase/poly(A) polymerase
MGNGTQIEPDAARQFAVEVVERLRQAGFEALWAGGCVRDQLLDKTPKDYDVATSATPDQVRQLFGHRRTHAVGASFGVITVLGPRPAGQIEVATFRRDAGYSDGRHPDSVTFSSAEEDAQRRDFTINGLFFDPLAEKTIDYVGGIEDLERRVIRAIGDPYQRFAEDKLRMLRAVRFAATFDFALDEPTLVAIAKQAHELVIVSAERIAAEMARMLVHENRAQAVQLLLTSSLIDVILPEARILDPSSDEPPNVQRGEVGQRTLAVLSALEQPAFGTALAALLRELPSHGVPLAKAVGERWRLAREDSDLAGWLMAHEQLALAAHTSPWPRVQRMLVCQGAGELVKYLRAVESVTRGGTPAADFCAAKLALPAEVLNPPPLFTGDDLKPLGIRPGPLYKVILDTVRDEQLEGRLASREEAAAKAIQIAKG